jgi:hypothetical protein
VAADVCRKLLGIKSPSFRHLNSVLLRLLSMLLLPASPDAADVAGSDGDAAAFLSVIDNPLVQALSHLSLHPVR